MRAADERCLAVGFFDGVHLGHRQILSGAGVALTFRRHPRSVLTPESAPKLLMSVDERVAAIRACGVERVLVRDFTRELAETDPLDFLEGLRREFPEGAFSVRCGENWRFGRGGAGDAAFLRAHGIDVTVVGYAEHDGGRISSSRIRTCLEAGRLAEANAMLGRPYSVTGRIVRGKGVGKTLGYPTVNLDVGRPLCLRRGVYAVEFRGGRGLANYGLAPTMGADAWREPVLEIHLLDAAPDALPPVETVTFTDFIRDERAFASMDELKRQIAADISFLNNRQKGTTR